MNDIIRKQRYKNFISKSLSSVIFCNTCMCIYCLSNATQNHRR